MLPASVKAQSKRRLGISGCRDTGSTQLVARPAQHGTQGDGSAALGLACVLGVQVAAEGQAQSGALGPRPWPGVRNRVSLFCFKEKSPENDPNFRLGFLEGLRKHKSQLEPDQRGDC